MTREALWSAYVARNPAFAGPGNVTLSAAGLRKLFEQTWDRGEEAGRAAAANGERMSDMFNEMFGGGGGSSKGGAK